MKLTTILLTISALLGAADGPAQDDKSASEAAADVKSEQVAARTTFLLRVRQLATGGDLFTPDSVAHILDMSLQVRTEMAGPAPQACGDGTMTSMEVTTAAPPEQSWFRELPSGAGHIEIPAFTINPATTSGDPKIEYQVYRSVHCGDWPRMRDHKQARLSFGGLPAFSCLTPSDISKEIPEIRPVPATDGVFIMRLEGRIDEDAAVTVNFLFRAGAACALSAEINQDQEGGHRYRRALAKYEDCRDPSDRDFCSKHPKMTWSDRGLRRKMVLQAYERCGTVNTFYANESSTGEPPPPRLSVRKHKSSPCDGL